MRAIQPSGPRDPWSSEVGEADHFAVFAFFAVLILFGAVGFGLYAKGSWDSLNPDNLLWHDRTAVKLQLDPGSTGQPPVPLTLRPGVAPQPATAPAPAKAEPTVAPQPTAVPAVYVPPVAAAMGIPGAQAQAQPTATAQPAPPPPAQPAVGTQYKVVNTSGDGVFIRRSPKLADRIVPWPDNTPMEYLGEQADGDGSHWAKMRDPRGNVGWVPTQYLGPM